MSMVYYWTWENTHNYSVQAVRASASIASLGPRRVHGAPRRDLHDRARGVSTSQRAAPALAVPLPPPLHPKNPLV